MNTTPGIVIRPLAGHAEMEQAVALQRLTWGEGFDQTVPATILWVAQRTGGIASGAFAGDGTLLGFVFGITGVENGRPIHWSDMLAVRPEARGAGLGLALKLHQRDLLLERGVEVVYWTFDPLVARNAHINFERLGVVSRQYLRDVYGETGSHLHAGIGTDRLVAEWHIAAPAPIPHAAHEDMVRIEVPLDIQSLKAESLERARAYRRVTREAFEHYLGRGYVVVAAKRSAEALHYQLAPPGA